LSIKSKAEISIKLLNKYVASKGQTIIIEIKLNKHNELKEYYLQKLFIFIYIKHLN